MNRNTASLEGASIMVAWASGVRTALEACKAGDAVAIADLEDGYRKAITVALSCVSRPTHRKGAADV